MSKYEQIARAWWATERPIELSEMTNPDQFFADLAEQVQAQVTEISEHLEQNDTPPADYLARMGWLNAIKSQAEEVALNQLIYELPPEEAPDETPSMLGPLVQEMHDLKLAIAHAVNNGDTN